MINITLTLEHRDELVEMGNKEGQKWRTNGTVDP